MYVRLGMSRFLFHFTDHNKCCGGPLRKAFRQQKLANHVSDEAQLSGLNRVTHLRKKKKKLHDGPQPCQRTVKCVIDSG